MRVWCRCFVPPNTQQLHPILTALEQAGLDANIHPPTPTEPGLVIFQDIDEDLQTFILTTKQTGVPRILAIGLTRTSLVNGSMWQLLQAGASDILYWDQPEATAQAIAARLTRGQQIDDLLTSPIVCQTIVGRSPMTVTVLRRLIEAAYFTDMTVLLMGESGTGKELAAQLIHALDRRQNKGELAILDCSTIVPELSGSEFFGHERGAFTGAVTPRDGAFALANGGTLFLDEVGELPLSLQGQLLRVIQERSYKRVGGNTWHRTDFRLICATNRDLLQEVTCGRFRRDLYYRIAGELITMPPLRERLDDIIPLAYHFMKAAHPPAHTPPLDDAVKEYLLLRDYPGNIRELRQLITRIMSRHVGDGYVTIGELPAEERPAMYDETNAWCDAAFERAIRQAIALGVGLKDIGRTAENLAVNIAVADAQGNLQRAAAKLKVTDRALQLRRATNAQ
ncbi:MAG: sigma 54-interacting transcriptional regulator [Nitrospira sp.]|nr:sigma 54-interacting transcriptional regulator [Nitrospira sp.]